MHRSQREAAKKPINYKSFNNSGVRLPPYQPTSSASSSDSESNAEKSTIEQTFNLYQSLYESDHDTATESIDANLSQLVQSLSLKESMMENDIKQLSIEQNVLSSDIADIGTDYDIEFMAFNELEQLFQKLVTMRSQLKKIHNEIRSITGDEVYEKSFEEGLFIYLITGY